MATAAQGSEHDATVRELNRKFVYSLIALGGSMMCVVIAAIAVIWVKDPIKEKHVALVSTIICSVLFVLTALSMGQMFFRLHTWLPANARLYHFSEGKRAQACSQAARCTLSTCMRLHAVHVPVQCTLCTSALK